MLTIPPGTQPGAIWRMSGLGAPRPGGGTGDELVEIDVEVPKKLTPGQRELVRKLRDELAKTD